MADDRRLERLQHRQLVVEVGLKQLLVRPARQLARLAVRRPVVVHRNRVNMVHRANEEVEREPRQRPLDQRERRRPDPVRLEANWDVDGLLELVAQP